MSPIEWLSIGTILSRAISPVMAIVARICGRSRLTFELKKDWSKVYEGHLEMHLEVYNHSSRRNVIRDYRISTRDRRGTKVSFPIEEWTIETHWMNPQGKPEQSPVKVNVHSLNIDPHSGITVPIGAFLKAHEYDFELKLQVEIIDLFEKHYRKEFRLRNSYGYQS
jgi:hypothetical protein